MGPVKRQLPNNKVDQFFEGVKVRQQPLPLRIQASPNPNAASAGTAASHNAPKPPVVAAAAAVTASPQLGTPRPVQLVPQTVVPAAAAANVSLSNPIRPAVPVTSLPSQPVTVNPNVAPTTPVRPSASAGGPNSPILTNLLHRRSLVPEAKAGEQQQVRRIVFFDITGLAKSNSRLPFSWFIVSSQTLQFNTTPASFKYSSSKNLLLPSLRTTTPRKKMAPPCSTASCPKTPNLERSGMLTRKLAGKQRPRIPCWLIYWRRRMRII